MIERVEFGGFNIKIPFPDLGLNVRPGFADDDGTNSVFRHAKDASQFEMTIFAGCIQLSDLNNFICGKLCRAIAFAFQSVHRAVLSTLRNHVAHVSDVATEPKMSRIDASRVIFSTWAVMANLFTFGNGAMVQFPRNTMRKCVASICSHDAIAFIVQGSPPKPTFVSRPFRDVSQKSFGKGTRRIIPQPVGMAYLEFGVLVALGWDDGLTATAFAKFNRSLICGMIEVHQKLSFLVTSRGWLHSARRFLLANYRCNYSTNTPVEQAI
jgi:hypothetical protein